MNAVTEILNSLRILVQSLQSASRTSEQKAGLSGAQLFVLQKLIEKESDKAEDVTARSLTVNELAERTHTHQSTVSVVVSKLVEKKLVHRVRSEADARVQLLSITPLGRKKVSSLPETIQDRLLTAIRNLDAEESAALSNLLAKVLRAADLIDKEPSFFLEESH